VNEADKAIIFHIEYSTYPNWNGAEQKRSFTVIGDELKYVVPTGSGGGVVAVVWKRAK
jgi:Lipocalin-like domain